MATVWDKIDLGLATLYSDFLRARAGGSDAKSVIMRPGVDGGKLHVELTFTGSLTPVEHAGFETVWTDGKGRATGAVRFEDLQRIADRDEVVTIHYGTELRLCLDKSIPQIHADQVWTLSSDFVFTGPNGTGAIVGIIDSGVDIHHPFLWARSIPTPATRILSIWDQGLIKVAGESEPKKTLLDAGTPFTYGVEYSDKQINAVINEDRGALKVRVKDCLNHGTHIASIAAGDGRFQFKFVGVAPRAELIIVKFLHLENQPTVGTVTVSPLQRLKDAVTYIRKVAAANGKPVVINLSASGTLGAHDGLNIEEDWLANEFKSPGSVGSIFVMSAGNAGSRRQHARIEFKTGSLQKEIPFNLVDSRAGVVTDFFDCAEKDNTKPLSIHVYYPKGATTLTCEIKPPGAADFSAKVLLGRVGPLIVPYKGTRSVSLFHTADNTTLISGAVVERNVLVVQVNPLVKTLHIEGDYILRLTASAPMVVHAWCEIVSKEQFFQLGTPLPPDVTDDNTSEIGSPAAANNVITVASYNAEVTPLDVAPHSSRGPLVRYSAVGGAMPAKPEIAAPGELIDAASSASGIPAVRGLTQRLNGTSFSAPHVAGAIALMLAKNTTLTPAAALAILQAQALTVPAPVANEVGKGRLDAKKAFDNTP